MTQRAAIILAAGQGTRMKSDLPKVMHKIAGRAMIDWSIACAQSVGCETIIVVCSPSGVAVRDHVTAQLGPDAIVLQDPPLGTGHAVGCARSALAGFEGDIVVLYGDTPLIPAQALEDLFRELASGARVGILGFEAEKPGDYGRLITNASGGLDAIVEAKDADPEERAIRLCNSGVLAAPCKDLFALLSKVTNDNAKGEYYLTDIVGLARAETAQCTVVTCKEADVLGVNSREDLAKAEAAYQARCRKQALRSGVTLQAPNTVYCAYDTQIAPDVIIEPHIVLGLALRSKQAAGYVPFHIWKARMWVQAAR